MKMSSPTEGWLLHSVIDGHKGGHGIVAEPSHHGKLRPALEQRSEFA